MNLNYIVLHNIRREEDQSPILDTATELLDPKDSVAIEFVTTLARKFSTSFPTHGVFEPNKTTFPFQTLLRDFLNGNEFLDFTVQAMYILEDRIKVPKAKGGYVLFAHYSAQGKEFLMTIMLQETVQFAITAGGLGIDKLKTLDTDKLLRANRVNIERWNAGDGTYLAFIKGRRDVSGFFQKFIGSTDLTSSRVNSKNLKQAVSKYFTAEEFDLARRSDAYVELENYMKHQFENKQDVQLEVISAIVNPSNPTSLIEFIHEDDELQVSGNFRVAKLSDIGIVTKAKIKSESISIEFDKALIKERRVVRKGNDLIFRDLPKDQLDLEFN